MGCAALTSSKKHTTATTPAISEPKPATTPATSEPKPDGFSFYDGDGVTTRYFIEDRKLYKQIEDKEPELVTEVDMGSCPKQNQPNLKALAIFCGLKVDEAGTKNSFSFVDADGDGKVTAEEYAKAAGVTLPEAREFIKKYDVDGDGKLDDQEWKNKLGHKLDWGFPTGVKGEGNEQRTFVNLSSPQYNPVLFVVDNGDTRIDITARDIVHIPFVCWITGWKDEFDPAAGYKLTDQFIPPHGHDIFDLDYDGTNLLFFYNFEEPQKCTIAKRDDGTPIGFECKHPPLYGNPEVSVFEVRFNSPTKEIYFERKPEAFYGRQRFYWKKDRYKPLDYMPTGDDADWDANDVSGSLERFRKNGFTVLPKGTVPLDKIEEARAHHVNYGDEFNIALLQKTPALYDVVTALLGKSPVPDYFGWVHPSGVGVTKGFLPPSAITYPRCDSHIDFGHSGPHLHSFNLLVGIPLNSSPKQYMGNFGVVPGSHTQLANGIKDVGKITGMSGYDALTTIGGGGVHHNASFNSLRWLPVERMPVKPLCVEVGQAYIAHQMVQHFIQPNYLGTDERIVLYYRICHPEQHALGCYDKDHYINPFRYFPAFGGEWPQCLQTEAAKQAGERLWGPWIKYRAQDVHKPYDDEHTYFCHTYNEETGERGAC